MDEYLERFKEDILRLVKDIENGKIILTAVELDTIFNAMDFLDPDWELKWPKVRKVLDKVNVQYGLQNEPELSL